MMAESDLSSLPDIDSDPESIGSETVTDGKSYSTYPSGQAQKSYSI